MLGWSDRHGFRGSEVLSLLQPNTVFCPRSKIHRRVVCSFCVSNNFRSLWGVTS
jgi:hypothetical protein